MQINEIRDKIDGIDRELSRLLIERLEIVKTVASYKIENNIPVLDAEREKVLLAKIDERIAVKEHSKRVNEIYQTILKTSRDMQQEMIDAAPMPKGAVAYQGVVGSYGEQAAIGYFGDGSERITCLSFEDVVDSVRNGTALYGVLPIENSLAGTVHVTNMLIQQSGLVVAGETIQTIEHQLMAKEEYKLEDIKIIYSHPQALEQCGTFLKTLGKETVPYINTAVSAQKVSKSNEPIAAIASKRAAKQYGLKILKSNIANNTDNYTRFFIITKAQRIRSDANKTSVVVTVNDKAGALYTMLGLFDRYKVNMHKIESRPVQEKTWEYYFYIDFEGNINEPHIMELLNDIKEKSDYFNLLGCYKQDDGAKIDA